MSNFHLITNPTPLSQANKLELGFRQLQKTVERKFGKKEDPSIVKSRFYWRLVNFIIIRRYGDRCQAFNVQRHRRLDALPPAGFKNDSCVDESALLSRYVHRQIHSRKLQCRWRSHHSGFECNGRRIQCLGKLLEHSQRNGFLSNSSRKID